MQTRRHLSALKRGTSHLPGITAEGFEYLRSSYLDGAPRSLRLSGSYKPWHILWSLSIISKAASTSGGSFSSRILAAIQNSHQTQNSGDTPAANDIDALPPRQYTKVPKMTPVAANLTVGIIAAEFN